MRPPEPFIFYIDRCLGRGAVPTAMRAALLADEALMLHDDIFDQAARDEDWIPKVGDQGWAIVTKDSHFTRRPNEQSALMSACTAVFVFVRGDVTSEQVGVSLALALPAMRKAIRGNTVPLVGRINLAGDVTVAWDNGLKLATARVIKVRRTGFKDE